MKSFLPEYGQVGILCITDKQFGQIELFYGKKSQEVNAPGQQLELFWNNKSRLEAGFSLKTVHFLISKFSSKPLIDSLKWTLSCFQWSKDTNLKANHNRLRMWHVINPVVFNGPKIQIWKQITTLHCCYIRIGGCFQWSKDTNLKANHNRAAETA